jgi:hypothetical protein
MKSLQKFLPLLLVMLMTGCASVSVSTDFDSSADFADLSTYSWDSHGPSLTGDARIDGNTLLQSRLTNAIDLALVAKGFQKVSSGMPSFVVNYHVSAQDKTDVESFGPSYYGGGYYGGGYRGGYYAGAYPMYGGGGGVTTFHYTEGTLIVDIINPATNHLIWRGTGTKIVNPDANSEQKVKNADSAAQKILASFPPIQ